MIPFTLFLLDWATATGSTAFSVGKRVGGAARGAQQAWLNINSSENQLHAATRFYSGCVAVLKVRALSVLTAVRQYWSGLNDCRRRSGDDIDLFFYDNDRPLAATFFLRWRRAAVISCRASRNLRAADDVVMTCGAAPWCSVWCPLSAVYLTRRAGPRTDNANRCEENRLAYLCCSCVFPRPPSSRDFREIGCRVP